MALRIFNTLTGEKEIFAPLTPPKVGIYVCGPTVYDLSHVGHARVYVAFDVVVRSLRARGYDVRYVRNFTDVDDKILKRAAELGEPPSAVSERFIRAYLEDMAALSVLPADVQPKVTEHIPEIVALIGKLVERGIAYPSAGDVYFAVRADPDYGKLSKRKLEEGVAKSQVTEAEGPEIEPKGAPTTGATGGGRRFVDSLEGQKRDPLDFALWKAAKPNELSWPSPWGPGRPGWHIECSAMSARYLGQSFDLHGGGKDLVFPHHENEIAQSECASGQPLSKIWMHNGFVTRDDEKMSKSLGNFFTIRDVLARFEPEALRLYLLGTHYRSPINFSDAGLAEAERRLDYFYETLRKVGAPPGLPGGSVQGEVTAALDDDFNTPEALAAFSAPFQRVNDLASKDVAHAAGLAAEVRGAALQLGLLQEDPAAYLARRHARASQARGLDTARIEALIAERAQARAAKDFARADAVRKELTALGAEIKDGPSGTTWKPVG